MTKLEAIQMIGDIIEDIDVARGSLLPNDPNRLKLDELRDILNARQQQLSGAQFDENTHQFQQASETLRSINAEIKGSIQRVDNIETVLNNVTTIINAAGGLLTAVGSRF